MAAIGNEGGQTTGSPGNDLFALSVGATDPNDRAAGFSGGRTQLLRESEYFDDQYLPLPYSKPELSAPGVAVYSCVPKGKWKSFSGTSMATPQANKRVLTPFMSSFMSSVQRTEWSGGRVRRSISETAPRPDFAR